jgi:taurine dioxygenase
VVSYPDLPSRWSTAGPRTIRRFAPGQPDLPYTAFNLRPLGPLLGAEISGLDLRVPLPSAVRSEVNRALLEWKVLFFRGQRLTSEQHRAFARLWGETESDPFPSADADWTAGQQNIWRMSTTWRSNPAAACVLGMLAAPAAGVGDMVWADAGAAYDNLREDVRSFIDELDAVHDFMPILDLSHPADAHREYREQFPPVAHPVVLHHPVTSRKTLFVNTAFTTHIPVLPPPKSEELLRFLFAQADIPELQVRWSWRAGDVAFWDNRATWHYAVSDYFPRTEIAERISISAAGAGVQVSS